MENDSLGFLRDLRDGTFPFFAVAWMWREALMERTERGVWAVGFGGVELATWIVPVVGTVFMEQPLELMVWGFVAGRVLEGILFAVAKSAIESDNRLGM